ncbi:MAG: Fpg/Nei family DNA glycosylase [Candidatus Dormibacteraeota bacterium]|nr:Fpg/Nei family DNA glycosylase [Candidatus Dormibacteraeota bacterium]
MPELPEVQALVESLGRSLRGDTIESVRMRSVAALKTYDPPAEALTGLELTGARRHGKFIDLEAAPLHLVVHLARAGWLRRRERPSSTRPAQRGPLLMVVGLGSGAALEATEQGTEKRLAVYVVRDVRDVPGIARLGVDALDESLTPDRLGALLAESTSTLKNALADQDVIAGVGNAYSDEILHAARLSPFRRANSLTASEMEQLHASLRTVLGDALQEARSLEPDSLRDGKRLRLRVHGRTGQRCPVCGDVVREVAYASRSFQYCATCQTGGRVYADRRFSRLLR